MDYLRPGLRQTTLHAADSGAPPRNLAHEHPSPKTALVTGASRGIGAAIAERLAADGFTVVVNYAGSPDEAEALVGKIEQAGGRAISAQADVADPVAVARHVRGRAKPRFGGVDVLVNNAGIMRLASLAESDDALFDSQVVGQPQGHVQHPARGRPPPARRRPHHQPVEQRGWPDAAHLRRLRRDQGRGRSDDATCSPRNCAAAASPSTRWRPGPTATRLFLDGKPQEVIDRLAKQAPLERLGEPTDIAAAVAFLAGPDGAWINGQVLRANGGII